MATTDPTAGWAKATEEASGAAKEGFGAIRELGHFLAPAFRPLVGMAANQFEVWQAQRQVRLAGRYQAFLRERGLSGPTREVAPAFLVPLLERASIEADDDLQDVWATMLANATDAGSETECRTAFVGMLGEMNHFDVLVLSKLEEATPREEWAMVETHQLPSAASVRGESRSAIKPPRHDVEVSLGNLARLGCLSPASAVGGFVNFGLVKLTRLGATFIKACSRSAATKP